VIRNGCDVAKFHPTHVAPAHLRERLEIASSAPVLLVVGRLEPQKGHHVLLSALPFVRAEFPDIRLVCVGDGSLRPQLEKQASDLGVAEAALFTGAQAEVADWLAMSDVCVLPSYYEGLPLVAIETLAAGRPMVATAVDGTSEVVVDGKTGLTVPPGDPQALAGAICRLLRSPELRKQLATAGRNRVLESFSDREQVRKTEMVYGNAWNTSLRRGSGEERLRRRIYDWDGNVTRPDGRL
jgi:glycosyltransferase involved in cell wall biosynthesis